MNRFTQRIANWIRKIKQSPKSRSAAGVSSPPAAGSALPPVFTGYAAEYPDPIKAAVIARDLDPHMRQLVEMQLKTYRNN